MGSQGVDSGDVPCRRGQPLKSPVATAVFCKHLTREACPNHFRRTRNEFGGLLLFFLFFGLPHAHGRNHTHRDVIYTYYLHQCFNTYVMYIHTYTHTHIYIWYRYSRTIDICIHVCSSPIIYGMTAYFPQSLHQVCESGFWLSAGMIQSGPEGELGRIQAPPVSSVSPGWKWQLFIFDL